MTHDDKIWDLHARASLLLPQGKVDHYLLRAVILEFITPDIREEKETDYICYTLDIVRRYKDADYWQNGIVEYIIRTQKEMGHWCNG